MNKFHRLTRDDYCNTADTDAFLVQSVGPRLNWISDWPKLWIELNCRLTLDMHLFISRKFTILIRLYQNNRDSSRRKITQFVLKLDRYEPSSTTELHREVSPYCCTSISLLRKLTPSLVQIEIGHWIADWPEWRIAFIYKYIT